MKSSPLGDYFALLTNISSPRMNTGMISWSVVDESKSFMALMSGVGPSRHRQGARHRERRLQRHHGSDHQVPHLFFSLDVMFGIH
jgi:hypothetical protein